MKNTQTFPINFRATFVLLAVAFLLAPSTSAQESEKYGLAQRMVEKAQLHKMAALGMLQPAGDGSATEEYLQCASMEDPSIFIAPIASLYADRLSSRNLREAIKFFESSAGQKYISHSFLGTEKYAGFTPALPATSVTIEEQRAIDAFVTSAVGRQISRTTSPLAISIQREIFKVIEPLLNSCRVQRELIQEQVDSVRSVYKLKLVNRIRSRLMYAGDISRIEGNPQGSVRVEQLPTGEVVSAEIVKSSGIPDYDAAVVKAVYMSSPLPKASDGSVRKTLVVDFFIKEKTTLK
jgi:TonB family protein